MTPVPVICLFCGCAFIPPTDNPIHAAYCSRCAALRRALRLLATAEAAEQAVGAPSADDWRLLRHLDRAGAVA